MSIALRFPFYKNPVLASAVGNALLTCSRASTRAMTDDDGWLREVQANEVAFEGARFRHNLHKQSNDFSTVWNNTRTTDSQNVGTDPFGGNEAQSINEDGTAASTHYVNYNPGASVVAGHKYLHSAYFKASNRSWVAMVVSGGASASAYFNVSTGTAGAGGTNEGTVVEDAGNGWYRCSFLYTATGTGGISSFIYAAEADNDITFDGLSQESVLVYGVQVEDVSGRWDSENLFTYSNDFTNGNWNESGVEIFAAEDQNVTGPNTNLGWTVVDTDEGTPASSAQIYRNQIVTEPGRYMFSVYLKANTISWVRLHHSNAGSVTPGGVYFDLANGAIGTVLLTSDYGIEDAGNGWYRCWIARDVHSDDLNNSWWIQLAEADGDVSYTRDGTHSFYIADAQFERKKPNQTGPIAYTDVPTSPAVTNYSPSTYIPTTTAAVSDLAGENDGLHAWPESTNLALQSEDFDTTWLELNGASTFNQTIAPDGSLTADKLLDSGATGNNNVAFYQGITVSNATRYTFSVFLKADQLTWAQLYMNQAVDPYCYFDLGTGAVGTALNEDDAGIEDYGNGWYRCWISFTTDDTTLTTQIRCADADADASVALDGTSSIFVWGAQLEAQDHPFPYMRTTTGSATANKDNIETSDCDWYNNDEGTFYMSISRGSGYLSTAQRYICEISTGLGNDRIFMYNTSNTPVMFATNGGVAQAIVSAADTPMSDDECLFVATYATDDFNVFADGSASASPDTSGTPSTATMTLFSVGKAFNETLHFAGLIKDIAFIPTKLSVTEATDLSAGDRSIESFGERRASLSRALTANLTRNLARGLAN